MFVMFHNFIARIQIVLKQYCYISEICKHVPKIPIAMYIRKSLNIDLNFWFLSYKIKKDNNIFILFISHKFKMYYTFITFRLI